MKILLHIGQSKTGTTAIQTFLTLNRRRLQKAGVTYPMPKMNRLTIDVGNHNAVADSLLEVSSYPFLTADVYFRQFYAECERTKAKRMILSAEHFWGGHPRLWEAPDENTYWALYRKKLETLASHLRGHEVSILVYLRPQVDWLASLISHNISFGWLPLDNSLVANLYESDRQHFNLCKPALRYSKILDIWNEIIAPESIVAVPYVRERLFQKSSIADFLRRAHLDHIDLPIRMVRMPANESLSREYVEVKKILNRVPRTMSEERAITECVRRLSRLNASSGRYELQSDVAEEVEAFVAADNVRLAEWYIKDGKDFIAAANRGESTPLTKEQIAVAMAHFEDEYRRAGFQLQVLSAWLRRFLRVHVRPLHAFLHQFKRIERRLRNG
jgi:hypothetical protein